MYDVLMHLHMRSGRADRRTKKGNYKEKTYRETEIEKSVKERVRETNGHPRETWEKYCYKKREIKKIEDSYKKIER
jgi:hypothetical protein